MSCQQFENDITDLARDLLRETEAPEHVLAHLSACATCAARFAAERGLTASLRAFAETSVADEKARPHVETNLLAAFREHTATKREARPLISAPSMRTTSRLTQSLSALASLLNESRRASLQSRWNFAAMTAGLLALMTLAALIAWRPSAVPQENYRAVHEERTPQPNAVSSPPSLSNHSLAALKASSPGQTSEQSSQEPTALNRPRKWRNAPHSRVKNSLANSAKVTDRDVHRQAMNASPASEAVAEITTDFFPLPHANALTSSDGGQMMRVELPRSALASFGLLVNNERDGRVKADVLLGDDGLARAIRFVR